MLLNVLMVNFRLNDVVHIEGNSFSIIVRRVLQTDIEKRNMKRKTDVHLNRNGETDE